MSGSADITDRQAEREYAPVTGGPEAPWLEAADRLCDSAEAVGWRGPDAYDGLWWRWPTFLVAGRRRRQAVMQLHARSPVDIRKLYRRRHPLIPKALGIFGSTRTRLHALTRSPRQRAGAMAALDELCAANSSGTPGWGYEWDMQTRWSFYAAHSPNVVVTSFAAAGLSNAAREFGVQRYAQRAGAAAEWVQEALFLPSEGIYCYHPESRKLIHNANLLGAALALRLLPGDSAARAAASSAVERTLAGQRADGSWPYGEGSGLGFVDSFHTGYVLLCLAEAVPLDPRVPEAIERGARYWTASFFGPSGEARLWPTRDYPEDAHAAGTALTTLAALVPLGLASPELMERVANRAVSSMMRGDHAIYRRYRWGTMRVQYLRWADAHMALGLANAALVAQGDGAAEGGS